MQISTNSVMFGQIFQAAVIFFFVFGIVGFAVGVGLIVNSEGMRRLFGVMNRWTSTRQGTKSLGIPRHIEGAVHKHRVWVGAVFVIGGGFGLLKAVDLAGIISALRATTSRQFAAWTVESLSWVLIVGNAFAVVIGLMLIFFPNALGKMEAHLNRWYSTRRLGEGGDKMHLGLDKWVEANPRAAGCIIAAASLIVLVSYGMVLVARA